MQNALKDADLRPEHVTSINCHATSTPMGDEIELRAIRRLFDEAQGRLANTLITSNKGSIGHLLGAAGAVESIFAVLSCHHATVPPTVNLEHSIDASLSIVSQPNCAWSLPAGVDRRIMIKNSFGFGGTNASLVIAEFKE